MTTEIKPGDLVWVVAGSYARLPEEATKGVVMLKIGDNWFRVHSSWQPRGGGEAKTNIQDFPSEMLRRVYEDESG